ncbi:MAG: mycofactocin biosynthesis glycosyltransferase MftF [Microthrixaceae bacterium]
MSVTGSTMRLRYRLDHDVVVLDDGATLLGGFPWRILRLGAAGTRIVEQAASREGLSPGHDAGGTSGDGRRDMSGAPRFVHRLVDASVLHPVPEPATGNDVRAVGGSEDSRPEAADVVVVVPVKDRPDALDRCLSALVASGLDRLVVVDDGSIDSDSHRRVAQRYGADLVAHDRSRGPAAARNTGARHGVRVAHLRPDEPPPRLSPPTAIAFVDSDVEVPSGWIEPLSAHLGDPGVGFVAPRLVHLRTSTGAPPPSATRVASRRPRGDSRLDRYEAAASPLDLGRRRSPIGRGHRVTYVPAAALLVRTEAFEEVGGFDESMSTGEDVDLVWRLRDARWRGRYEPDSWAGHRGDRAWPALLGRRYAYGRAAAVLDRAHPGSVAPVVLGPRGALIAGATLWAGPPAALAGWALDAAALWRRLNTPSTGPVRRTVTPGRVAGIVARGHLQALGQVARAMVRPYLPVTLAACLISRRVRRIVLVSTLVERLARRPTGAERVEPLTWLCASLADDIAYSAGVWAGCIAECSPGALLPATPRGTAGSGQN